MTMTIECTSCHAKFAGKREYAGRRMRCPKCQNVFHVPEAIILAPQPSPVIDATLAGAPPPASDPAVAPAPKNKYAGVEIDEWNVPEDFEYTVTDERDPNADRCPFCHGEMRQEDVLCLKCGYNCKLGQKMATKHSAEVAAEEESQARTTSVSFAGITLSKKALAIGGGVAAVVTLLLYLLLPTVLMALLLAGGAILMLVGQFGVVYVAFQEDSTQGFLTLLMPIYWWVFVFSRWELAALPFIVWVVGFVMMLIAGTIGWSAAPDEVESALLVIAHAARLAQAA